MMYNDTEYRKAIENLAACCMPVRRDGYSLLVKSIPGVGHSGDIDPVVLELLQKLNADPGPESIDLTELGTLRACMNWKSLDITTMLLNVLHRSFQGRDGNKIRLRVYSPSEIPGCKPCVMYFHGGGWIGGQMAYVENVCKLLAERAEAVVVSVEYRFAPEHPFPAGFQDCFDAVSYVYNNSGLFDVDPSQIAVCGDSAGANFAAACAICDRDRGSHMIRCQMLAYPCVNPFSLPSDYYTWSYDQYEVLYHEEEIKRLCIYELPVQRCMKIVEEAYLQGKPEHKNPYASPLFVEDTAGLAPAIFIIPEYDYLRLEGEAYAKRLADAGIKVKLVRYRGINHGFVEKVGQYPQAEDAINEMAKYFREILTE